MSAISKTILRQTFFLYRVHHLNITRQTYLPFSTSIRCLAETTTNEEVKPELKSYDSVPIHLSSFGKLIMVLGGVYGRISDVPDTLPNRVYQRGKDKFRARCVIASLFGTGLLAFIAAMRGKSARKEGKHITDDVYKMHRGESRVHEQLELLHKQRNSKERYSPPIDEVNK